MAKIDELLKELCPDGVEYVKLKDICLNVCSGGTPLTSVKEYYSGSNPWLRTQEVDWNDVYDTEIKISDDAIKNSSAKVIPANCLIVAMYGATAGKCCINRIPLTTNQACCNLQLDERKALVKFVFYWVCKEYQQIKAMGEGSQSNINSQKVKSYPVPLPPLEFQNEVVEILGTFTDAISNLEEELALREKQFEYYLHKILSIDELSQLDSCTYRIELLGNIGKICMCKRIMKDQTNTTSGVPFYKIGTFGKEADAYISYDLYNEYKSKFSFPKKGEVLISASGTIGRTVIYNGEDAYFQDSNIVWIENSEDIVLNKYLYYSYMIMEWVTEGGTIKRLYNSNLAKMKIVVPSIERQQEIVEILDTFEAMIANIKEEIALRTKQYEYYREKLLSFGK